MFQAYPAPDDPFLGVFLIVYAFIFLIALVFGLAQYVMEAVGLSKIAKSCRYPRPWLAWIPFANSYLIGKLAEVSAVRFGKSKRPYAVWLLTLQIIGTVLSAVPLVVWTALLINGVAVEEYSAAIIAGDSDVMSYAVFATFPLSSVISILSVLELVVQFLAYHLIFMLFDEKNAILFVLLSLLVSFAFPIILLILSRRAPNLPVDNRTPPISPVENATA